MNDISDLSRTVVPKSDQLNAEDLLSGDITVSVQSVRASDSPDQPISIEIDGGHKPYKPCKSMRRLLIFAWGKDGNKWPGRSMVLNYDGDVTWGGVKVGGIRIKALSDIEADFVLALSEKKGKRKPHHVKKLSAVKTAERPAYPPDQFTEKLPAMLGAIADKKMTPEQVIAQCEKTGTLTAEQKAQITAPIPAKTEASEEQF